MQSNYIPSFDFNLFSIPWVSPLQAGEYGAESTFRANTPISFVNYSLSQLAGLTGNRETVNVPIATTNFFGQPQDNAQTTRDRIRSVRDEADRLLKQAGGDTQGDCPQGRNILGGCGPILGSKKIESVDSSVGKDPTDSGKKAADFGKTVKEYYNALPQGAGVFLIALVAIIFLVLFVRK